MPSSNSSVDSLQALYKKNEKQALQDYFTFLKFQSISTDPAYARHVQSCAEWLLKYVKDIGFEAQLWDTGGHPTLFASYMKAGPDKPTLLIYNHYDVQPIDPIEEWISPPFEPTVRDGQVYARGAQDNKGQCFYTIQALKALIERDKKLPINIKLCIEGEEEIGSSGLAKILKKKQNELKADFLAIVDVGILSPKTPSVTLGVRGLITMDVSLHASKTDLHSGSHGGIAYNPIHALVELLAKLRDSNGKITVPGFYDEVLPVDKKKGVSSLPFNEQEYREMFGIPPNGGEKEFSPKERNWLRPTLEINGISGGYSGSGFKTVIPAKAHAKISCRLVPNQDPNKIGELVAKYLKSLAPEGVSVEVHVHPGKGYALRANPSSKIVQAFAQAYGDVFNAPCEHIFEGASIPIVTELAAATTQNVVLVGLGLGDDQIHAPNEHFGLDRFEKGFIIIARTIEILGNQK